MKAAIIISTAILIAAGSIIFYMEREKKLDRDYQAWKEVYLRSEDILASMKKTGVIDPQLKSDRDNAKEQLRRLAKQTNQPGPEVVSAEVTIKRNDEFLKENRDRYGW